MEASTILDNQVQTAENVTVWKTGTRIGFRFSFLLFGLFIFPFPLGIFPYISVVQELYEKMWRAVVPWVGNHILGITHEILRVPTGSGDTCWQWVHAFCVLSIAVLGAIIWSIIDRKRPNYRKLYRWFTIFLRYSLAAAMFGYGLDKVFPLQMPYPRLATLIQPYGEFSPMRVLWSFIGTSTPYEVFAGSVETVGGLLLIFPRTATLGAITCAAAMFQVWMLNMCYDVSVKLYSFTLLLESVFLLAPMLGRIGDLLVFQKNTTPRPEVPLFKTQKYNTIALVLQIVLGLYLFGSQFSSAHKMSTQPLGYYGAYPPLYGIWNVGDLTVDGQAKPPLITDATRWRRVVFQLPNQVAIQPMDGMIDTYTLKIDTGKKTLNITNPKDKQWQANLTYQQPSPDQLVIDGDAGGHKIHANLSHFDDSQYLLKTRGFHWVQEQSFNH